MCVGRVAVVSGSNKGIGFEICRQLAKNGMTVILTARDEKKGLAAVEKLKRENVFSDQAILFHLLDVSNPDSIASLAAFVKTHFGKLDILVSLIIFLSIKSLLVLLLLLLISASLADLSKLQVPFQQITLVN